MQQLTSYNIRIYQMMDARSILIEYIGLDISQLFNKEIQL